MNLAAEETWNDMPSHPLLTTRAAEPLIETRVSKTFAKPLDEVFAHFWGSQPELRLDLHKDHVKAYYIHDETQDTLEYEYVFEAYGTRNWGKAAEVATRPYRIDVEVKAGPLVGQTVTTLFDVLEPTSDGTPQTKVTQVNRVWPGDADLTVKLMGNKLKSQLAALAGVHLEQHRSHIEGKQRFVDKFSKQHQAAVAKKTAHPVKDLLQTTRAVALPIILFPLLGAAALAAQQGVFSWTSLGLTLLGGAAALLGANLLNDLFDFKGGADQSARTVPGQIETGSGAFTEGRWSLRKGWVVTGALFGIAAAAGAYLAWSVTFAVVPWAVLGALLAYVYIGPPAPLAYKGRGLGELVIFVAFGLAPVAGGVLAHGGAIDAATWWVASLFGLTGMLVLYHHHFLHWEADRLAGKGSPVAMLGPENGARLGMVLVAGTTVAVAGAVAAGALPLYGLVAAITPWVLWGAQWRVARGAVETPDRVRVAQAAFAAMLLTNLAMTLVLWI